MSQPRTPGAPNPLAHDGGRPDSPRRRQFLIGASALATSLSVGGCGGWRDGDNPLQSTLPADALAMTPYVRIDAQGVTLITPRADLGQGAYSLQAALLAEELDLAWGSFQIDPGPPSGVYANTMVLAEGMPIAATSDTWLARQGRAAGGLLANWLGLHITGGSTTASDGFDKLRVAGAVARQWLLLAASQQTGIPLAQLNTSDGQVLLPDGRKLSYGSLVASARQIPAPRDVALKPATQWRLLGKPLRRLDIEAKSTGRARYGLDVRLDKMVYATVRTNPRRGGAMLAWDAKRAKAARGVLHVMAIENGVGVIADNTWRAFQAAQQLEISWGPAPYPATTAALFAQVEAAFDEQHRDSRFKNEGDVDALLAGATETDPKWVRASYRVPYLAHAPLEPMNAVVQFKDGWLDIWTGTQIPRFAVRAAAEVSGLKPEQIRLWPQIMGGSFGRRLEDDFVRQAVALAKSYPNVPIKMTWQREEDMTHDFPRPLAVARAQGRVGQQVEVLDLAIAAPSVNASQTGRLGIPAVGPDVAIVAGAWDQPYGIAHYRVTGYRAPEAVPVSSWRSVGASANAFFHECFLDELIHAAGADPLTERLRLCQHAPSRRVLEAVGELSGWHTPLPAGRARGLAFTLSFGVPTAEVVEVEKSSAGIRIVALYAVAEVGIVLDPVNAEAQLAGGALWGLGHAMYGELTYADGAPEQSNFHQFLSLRLAQTPKVVARVLQTTGVVKGLGEPGVPPAAPALANALFAATGQRLRELPLHRTVKFVS